MYVSCFHSYSSLVLFVCIHVYNAMAFLYTLIPVYFFNFFLILCDFYILRCFVSFLSLSIPTSYMFIATGSIHAKSYFNMKNLFNKPSINKHQAWSRINEDEYELHEFSAVLWRGGNIIDPMISPIYENKHNLDIFVSVSVESQSGYCWGCTIPKHFSSSYTLSVLFLHNNTLRNELRRV